MHDDQFGFEVFFLLIVVDCFAYDFYGGCKETFLGVPCLHCEFEIKDCDPSFIARF